MWTSLVNQDGLALSAYHLAYQASNWLFPHPIALLYLPGSGWRQACHKPSDASAPGGHGSSHGFQPCGLSDEDPGL